MLGSNLSLTIARIPPKVMLVAMIALALTAGVLVEVEMHKKDDLLSEQKLKNAHKDMAPLLVATRDIAEGAPISADAVRVDTVESGQVPLGALKDTSGALGLLAKSSIHAGDSILFQNLQPPQRLFGFEAKIKPGFRAITFPVDTSTGVAGFLAPDCHVDILAQTGSGAEANVVPILSDVQVVAVGQTYQKKAGVDDALPTSCVTVAVMPADGRKLIGAMGAGKLYCLMRNQVDHAPLAVRDISSAFPKPKYGVETELSSNTSLPSIPPPVAVPSDSSAKNLPALPPIQHSVDIWSASKKDNLSFPE